MKVSIIGSGYVGTTTALCLSELGNRAINIDVDEKVVDSLNNGDLHIYEPELEKLLNKHHNKDFRATNDYSSVLETDLTFLCLPTPSKPNGEIDLSIIKNSAKKLGKTLRKKDKEHFVIVKSTVLPGTTEKLGEIITNESSKELGKDLFLGMNPEFLREGNAVDDFMEPDKLVLGGNEKTRNKLKEIYRELIRKTELFETDVRTAELIKYANNSLLATKISYANEIGNICKELDIDTYEVMDAVGKDHRVKRDFLDSGVGFGGSCFPKDVKAIKNKLKELNLKPKVLKSVLDVNEKQPIRIVDLLEEKVNGLDGMKVGVLGLAFKPGTDDVRNSQSIPVIKELKRRDAEVIAHDPKAIKNMKEIFQNIVYKNNPKELVDSVDGCLLLTDWEQYKSLEIEKPCIEGRRLNNCRGICW